LQEPNPQLHQDVPPADEQQARAGVAADSAAAGVETDDQSQSTSEQAPPVPSPPSAALEPDSAGESHLGTELLFHEDADALFVVELAPVKTQQCL